MLIRLNFMKESIMATNKEEKTIVTVHLNAELAAYLKAQAKANYRTVKSQLEYMLKVYRDNQLFNGQ